MVDGVKFFNTFEIFSLEFLSIVESGMLNSSTIIVDLSISLFL